MDDKLKEMEEKYNTDELFDFDTIHNSKSDILSEGYSEVVKKIEDKYVDIERAYELDDSGKIPMIEELKSLGKNTSEAEYKAEKNYREPVIKVEKMSSESKYKAEIINGEPVCKLEETSIEDDFSEDSIEDDFESMYDFSVLDYMDSDDEVLLQDELYDNEDALREREEIESDLGKIYSLLSENGIDLNKFSILPKNSIIDGQEKLYSNIIDNIDVDDNDEVYDVDKIGKTLDEIYKSLKNIEEKLSKL